MFRSLQIRQIFNNTCYIIFVALFQLNGINTQGENIADNGGIKEAYRAYVAWEEENGEEARLPGFQDYTPRQMFWISAASVWCSVYRYGIVYTNRIVRKKLLL